METPKTISGNQLKELRKLTQKKFRSLERKYIIEGLRLVEEALASEDSPPELTLCTPAFCDKEESRALLKQAAERKIGLCRISGKEFATLTDTVNSQGVAAVVRFGDRKLDDIMKRLPESFLVAAFDDVSDPGNLGTMLRTCDWFGVDAVILSRNTVELYNPKVVRSAMGSILHLSITVDADLDDAIMRLKKNGATVIAAVARGGTAIQNYIFPKKSVLLFGSEAHGIAPSLEKKADALVTIPGIGNAESLNVGISCGILLAAARVFGRK